MGARSIVSDILFFQKNLARKRRFESFITEYLHSNKTRYQGPLASQELMRDYKAFDALICGSDQIWNLDCTKGPVGPYFLDFASAGCKKIAYAPSLSHAKFEDRYFTPAMRRQISGYLNSFDAISVRELNTAQTFQTLTNKPIVEAVDPTLLLTAQDYRSIEETRLPHSLQRDSFVFAYTLWQNPEMNQYVSQLARENNLTIVYSSRKPIHYGVRSINCFGMSPNMFLALIDNAKYVISNSFHATVFSILFEKRFLTYGKDQSTSRMSNLLSKLDLLNHLVDEHYHGDTIPPSSDYKQVKISLSKLSSRSKKFLKTALSN
jgi:hypothetical protein